jgi:hypothetical protein
MATARSITAGAIAALVTAGLLTTPAADARPVAIASVATPSASVGAGPASSARHVAGTSETLGQVAPNPNVANVCGTPFTALQAASVVPNQYVAPAAGVITSFSTAAKTGVLGTARAVIFVPAGAGTYTQVGKSDFGAVTPSSVSTFSTRIPVPAGAILGIQFTNGAMACAQAQAASTINYNSAYSPDSPAGPFSGSPGPFLLNVAAVWESDADADGFGDVTQDFCPQSGLAHVACPAPDTKVTKQPRKSSTTQKVRITFTSVAGATYTCAVDGAKAKHCMSPFKKKFGFGKHKVVITATSAAGIADATPAVVKFEVTRPPH